MQVSHTLCAYFFGHNVSLDKWCDGFLKHLSNNVDFHLDAMFYPARSLYSSPLTVLIFHLLFELISLVWTPQNAI